MAKKTRIPHKFLPWIDARKQFRLTDAQIQMARELGLSPKRFGKYADRKDQPWKLPLPEFIEALYEKQFGKAHPDEVKSMEQLAAEHLAKRAAKKAEKENEPESRDTKSADTPSDSAETISADTISAETSIESF